jgi:hypothetical protein
MPKPKNQGPCIISGCDKPAPYRKLQIGTMDKIRKKDLENKYYFLKEGDQLCYSHYMKIVEPDRHDKHKNDQMKRKSSESLDVDYSKNLQTESNDSYNKSSSNQSDDTSSDNLSINMVDNQLDWSKIKINLTGSNVTMSKEDFLSIVEHIDKIELQPDNNLYCVEDNEEPGFDAINNEIDDGNLFLIILKLILLIYKY